jgi:hypothetical protein
MPRHDLEIAAKRQTWICKPAVEGNQNDRLESLSAPLARAMPQTSGCIAAPNERATRARWRSSACPAPNAARSVGLTQFFAEKLYGHQCGNNTGTDHGWSTNLLAG